MALDPALQEALDSTLSDATDQDDDFRKRFRRLIELVLIGNYEDSDVRTVMDTVHVVAHSED